MVGGLFLAALFAAAPLKVDAAKHSVSFAAKATGVEEAVQLEFLFVGPDSDRDYEAMFVTESPLQELVAAIDKAGFPMGRPVNPRACSFWPAGVEVKIEPDIWSFVRDTRDLPHLPVVWTGGTRTAGNFPEAATNMQSAFFALYSCGQSPLLFDDTLDQSATYGRFQPIRKLEKGKTYTFTLSWNGAPPPVTSRPLFAPENLRATLESLRSGGVGQEVIPVLSPDLTVREAKGVASALDVLDSRKVKVNGFADGQFFYRGFLPLEKWRDRTERLTQPLEVRLGATNAFTIVEEDWNVEGTDPKLTPRAVSLSETAAFKGDTCLFYAPGEMKLERVFSCMKLLPKTIRNWYVFCEP